MGSLLMEYSLGSQPGGISAFCRASHQLQCCCILHQPGGLSSNLSLSLYTGSFEKAGRIQNSRDWNSSHMVGPPSEAAQKICLESGHDRIPVNDYRSFLHRLYKTHNILLLAGVRFFQMSYCQLQRRYSEPGSVSEIFEGVIQGDAGRPGGDGPALSVSQNFQLWLLCNVPQMGTPC